MVINLTNQNQGYAHTVHYIRDIFLESFLYFDLQWFRRHSGKAFFKFWNTVFYSQAI